MEPTRAELATKEQLTVGEAAAFLGVHPKRIHAWMTAGITIAADGRRCRVALRGKKVGGRWRIDRADLDRFIEATTAAALSPDALSAVGETAAGFRRRADADEALARELLGP